MSTPAASLRRRPPERGFALAALMAVVAVLAIMVTVTEPVRRVQAQRALEEELIFRGEEYVRAIRKYQRRFGIYPPDVDALLETDGVRFLRRAYVDPITGAEFRLLTLNPDGTINGATVFPQEEAQNLFRGGNPQAFGAGPGGVAGRGGISLQMQSDGQGGIHVSGTIGPAGQSGTGFPASTDFQPLGRGAGGGPGFQPAQSAPGFSLTPFNAGFASPPGGAPAGASGLVGVAPANEAESLKLYKNRGIYQEWEFIALPGAGGIPGAGNVIPAPQESGGINP